MQAIKLVCLGGGSLYFRRVLCETVQQEDLSDSEMVL